MKESFKIFNIGFNKSGSTSLTKAMEILGFRSIHYNYNDERLVDLFRKNQVNNKKLLDGVENFDFFSDFSGFNFYKNLDEQYPNSKFILTIRELNSWLESREKHVKKNQQNLNYKGTWLVVDRLKWKKKREEYLFKVKKYFEDRQNDFLIIDICDGGSWKELCDFLSKPIPSSVFPYLNKSLK